MVTNKISGQKKGLTLTASVWYTLSNIASRGLNVIFTPVFTRILSPEDYGIYPLFVSWMGIFTVICSFEITGSLMYRALAKFKGDENSVLSSALGIEIVLSVIFTAVYIIFSSRINALTNLSSTLTLLLIFQVFLNSVLGILFAQKRYFCDYKSASAVNIGIGIGTPLLALLLIYLGGGGISRIISPLVISFAFATPVIITLIRRERKIFDREKWKYFFKLSVPMLPHYFALSVIAGADKIMISHIMNDGATGKYSVAYSVGFTVSLITSGLALAVVPWIMRRLSEGDIKDVKERTTLIFGIATLATIMFLATAPELFKLAAPEEYYDAFYVVYPVSLSAVFLFLANILSSAILNFEAPLKIMRNSLTSMLLFLLLSFILIKEFGYIGGALATLIGYISLAILNTLTLKRISGNFIIDIKSCLQNTALLFIFTILLYVIRSVPVSRILIAAAVILIFIPKLKKAS